MVRFSGTCLYLILSHKGKEIRARYDTFRKNSKPAWASGQARENKNRSQRQERFQSENTGRA